MQLSRIACGFRFYMNDFGGGTFCFSLCVLNSHDSRVRMQTMLFPGNLLDKSICTLSFTEDGDFDIGVVTPQLDINKGRNLLTNGSFETPAMINQATNVEIHLMDGTPVSIQWRYWKMLVCWYSDPILLLQASSMLICSGIMTGLSCFTLSTTSTVFFSGIISNQAAQYSYLYPWTFFCGILDDGMMYWLLWSDIMNFTNTLTDKPWYQLSGTVLQPATRKL